ncbi:YqaA family protein [Shewanella sp. OMA3-2]|uniref:YqaA family protein n=1 Tax=Shewanella sp. OMA3-2 TaxID=2908650 RepID=UPI001F428277|nr:YqaA family protein [Shewanella sp. OMA3-2]UJF21399.1 DedA family protein [Shewanella sp. OMA3-2]
MTELWLMFSGAFLAATLLPGGSEILLIGLLQQNSQPWLALLIVASVGNTLGAVTSYYLGRAGRFAKSPTDFDNKYYQRALRWFERFGVWALLLSWLPLIGDFLCLIAGWSKLPVASSIVMILIGKTVRYSVIVFIFMAAI